MQVSYAGLPHLALAASLTLTSCTTTLAGGDRPGGNFWADLAAGRYSSLSKGQTEVTGYVLKRARMAVTLSPIMPEKLSDGTYNLDANGCVVLLLSDAQYALLENGAWINARGEFGVRSLSPGGGEIVTQPSIRDRRAQPICSSAEDWTDSLLFYVEEIEIAAPQDVPG